MTEGWRMHIVTDVGSEGMCPPDLHNAGSKHGVTGMVRHGSRSKQEVGNGHEGHRSQTGPMLYDGSFSAIRL